MAEYPGLKCPRLTPEELSRSVDRLSRTPKKDVKELVQERRTLGGDQLEAFFERFLSCVLARISCTSTLHLGALWYALQDLPLANEKIHNSMSRVSLFLLQT